MFPFLKSLNSFRESRLYTYVLMSIAISGLLILGLITFFTWLGATEINLQPKWLDLGITFLIGILSGIAGWFMFPAFMILVAGFFQEAIIQKVAAAEYDPDVSVATDGLFTDLKHDLLFTAKAIGLNILILPTYVLGIGFIFSVLLNGFLLGREFFVLVARYYEGNKNAHELFRYHRNGLVLSGLFFTGLSLIPIVNTIVPILAVVWMVHVYHFLRHKKTQP
jgi:CysZ protein